MTTEELREKIAKKFALYKHGGIESELYPHWVRAGKIEANEILSLFNQWLEERDAFRWFETKDSVGTEPLRLDL